MKIAYILGEYPSLSETFIAREIEALRRRGFEIDIWALQAGEGARQIKTPAFSASRAWRKLTQSDEKYWNAAGISWSKSEFESLKSVSHVHAGWASHPAFIARSAAEVLGVPFSFSGHARDLWVEGEALDAKLRVAKFAGCCTHAGVEYLRKIYLHNCYSPNREREAEKKIIYAPHGIELSKYEFQAQRAAHEPIRVLAVGRLIEKKGFEELLAAISSLAGYPRYRLQLEIIGDGPLRAKLEKTARIYKISDFVFFRGALSNEQVVKKMQEADVFAMSSRAAKDGDRDGLPNVLLEAAACGLPIVSTRAGSITDFLDESCAWLSDADDFSRFRELIGRAVEMYDESLARAQVARKRVEEDFDVDRNIEVLVNAFISS